MVEIKFIDKASSLPCPDRYPLHQLCHLHAWLRTLVGLTAAIGDYAKESRIIDENGWLLANVRFLVFVSSEYIKIGLLSHPEINLANRASISEQSDIRMIVYARFD
jgi:hypothetical protein